MNHEQVWGALAFYERELETRGIPAKEMTEEEYGQRMRDMCRREGHHQGIPHKHVHGNPAPRLNYDIVMADVLALLADGPLPSPAIETRLKRGHAMSWALARRAKISMNRSGKRVGIYHCRHCRAWHVGSRKFPRGRK